MSFFLWRVDCALEGLVLTEQMCFDAAFFILWGRDTYTDFLRLLFLVEVICPLI